MAILVSATKLAGRAGEVVQQNNSSTHSGRGSSDAIRLDRRVLTIRRIIYCTAFFGAASLGNAASAGVVQRSSYEQIWVHVADGMILPVQDRKLNIRVNDVTGLPGQPIPLNIRQVGDNQTSGQLFLLTGIPDGITLNLGGFLGDFWAVNSKVIDKLTLMAPPDFTGSFTINITQSGTKPGDARFANFKVTIGDGRTTQTSAARTGDPVAKPDANESMLLGRGRALFLTGDVSGARAIFEFLASQGSAAAAIAMGESYDPLTLKKLIVKGLEPDAEKAQLWYQKAEELGSDEARSRLNGLARSTR